MQDNEKYLEISQAAKLLTVSESTVRRMIKDPNCSLKAVKIFRGCWRIQKSSIELVLKSR